MNAYTAMAIVISIAALFAYINARYIKLPTTIIINAGSLLISLLLLILGLYGYSSYSNFLIKLVDTLNFHDLLLQGMLSLLLFAGAMTIPLRYLRMCKWEIGILAFAGTIVSTFMIGFGVYALSLIFNLHVPLLICLLFGALISPTDPIAVIAIFKEIKAPKKLDAIVSGESLFNDGVGIVMFLTLSQLAFSTTPISLSTVSMLFLQQAIGGMAYGLVLGFIGAYLLKPVDDHKTAVLISLAIAMGGYAFSEVLHVSGPLAMVVAGIFIGNHEQLFAKKMNVRKALDEFWELIDEILNAILFLVIGLELIVIQPHGLQIILGVLIIPIALFARFFIVGVTMSLFQLKKTYDHHSIAILTWGGLRGGLAIALALDIPDNPYRSTVLTITYMVVIFAILVQGISIKSLAVRSKQKAELVGSSHD